MENIVLPPLYERFEEVALYYGLSLRQLSTRLQLSSPQVFYDIKSGKVQSISRKFLEAIKNNLPEINSLWLISGEGEMLKTDEKPESAIVISLLAALKEAQAQNAKSQEQIDRLLGIIEKLQSNAH